MLLANLTSYFGGVVYIKITGHLPEKFINLCMNRGIPLWGIAKKSTGVYAYIRLGDFFAIRPLVKLSQTRIEVVGYRGFPFFLKRLKRRKMLVIGAVVFCILLQYLSSFIWFVHIEGLEKLPPEAIRAVLDDAGLKPGSPKDAVEPKQIERMVRLTFPEIAWISVRFMGTRAVVEIAEKSDIPEKSRQPAHLVAAKSGVIEEFIVLAGQPNCKPGDWVRRGDILIMGQGEGSLPPRSGQSMKLPGIKAEGIVKAKVHYESLGEAELHSVYHRQTGKQVSEIRLKILSQELLLKPVQPVPYADYETQVFTKRTPWWRNSDAPVELTMKVFYETEPVAEEKNREECIEIATGRSLAALSEQIPETAQIITKSGEPVDTGDPNIVCVKYTVETIEDIGESRNILQGG